MINVAVIVRSGRIKEEVMDIVQTLRLRITLIQTITAMVIQDGNKQKF